MPPKRQVPYGWFGCLALIAGQALAYLYVLPLSLGPRVILAPWLIQQGYTLYQQIGDEHAPLLTLLLVPMQSLFADGLIAAKLTLILLMTLIPIIILVGAERRQDRLAGFLSTLFFALWSPAFGYGKLWHETFLAVLYIILLTCWRYPGTPRADLRRSGLYGLLLGLALLAKQQALVTILGFTIFQGWVAWHSQKTARDILSETLVALAAFVAPLFLFMAYQLMHAGTLSGFFFWTFSFSFINNYIGFASLAPQMVHIRLLTPAFILVPVLIWRLCAEARKVPESPQWVQRVLAIVLLAASTTSVYPRFGLFHLQSSLPILAWISGIEMAHILRVRAGLPSASASKPLLGGMAMMLLVSWVLGAGSLYYEALQTQSPPRIWEYSDLVPLSTEIRQHMAPGDRIYVMPDDEATANLYYLLRSKPPPYWVPIAYPWFQWTVIESPALAALKSDPPQWVVYFPGRWDFEKRGKAFLDYVQSEYRPEAELAWADGSSVWLLGRKH